MIKEKIILINEKKVITLKDISRVYNIPYIIFKDIFDNIKDKLTYGDDYVELRKEGFSITDLKKIEESYLFINNPLIPMYALTIEGYTKLFNEFETMIAEKNISILKKLNTW